MYTDVGSWSLGPVGVRRALDGAAIGLTVGLFGQLADPDFLVDVLWVTLALGGFILGLRRILVRVVGALAVMVAYSVAAEIGWVKAIDFELLELTEWPVMLVIALVVALMADRVSGTARHYANLYRAASDRLVRAQEEERERLARDLHDSVGQNLTAVVLTLDAAEADATRSAVRKSVRHARDLAMRSLDEVRDVATRLRPARIQEIGLGAAVSDLAGAAGIPIELRFEPASLAPGLFEPEREINVFRIIQEALANAARHAHASSVWVDADVHEGAVAIVIGDDGIGFEPSPRSRGLGLTGMEERASLLHGELRLTSRPGAGTLVELLVPLDPWAVSDDQSAYISEPSTLTAR